jgi:hypothetical protein
MEGKKRFSFLHIYSISNLFIFIYTQLTSPKPLAFSFSFSFLTLMVTVFFYLYFINTKTTSNLPNSCSVWVSPVLKMKRDENRNIPDPIPHNPIAVSIIALVGHFKEQAIFLLALLMIHL